ncbi:SRPBCC domain-containing protein [Reichenbachiella carrageenanivorans]|uniref:SRPBCC domain-containing protein n=1 Tax=Reichenbachiella carrageenanivorans TaxID=2979869 RepID=A0ABY6CZ74_9BACT|nr:SRPBCC domain-containing protein [Reichenbachiella carrageenanivorans]UXX78675.1 SRPBCC domain-containing protein [Reichenbachiella carrageenanivorans]
MKTEIENEWVFEQKPNEVWEYLTKSELIALWLMPNNFKLILGHEFQFNTNPIPSLDLDGVFHCKIIEIIPLQRLVYSWKGVSGNGDFSLDTIVEWNLVEHNNGAKLILKHSGFKEINFAIFTGMTDGWQKNIQKMLNHLNTTK